MPGSGTGPDPDGSIIYGPDCKLQTVFNFYKLLALNPDPPIIYGSGSRRANKIRIRISSVYESGYGSGFSTLTIYGSGTGPDPEESIIYGPY